MLTNKTKLSLAIMAALSIGFTQAANAAIDFESVAVGSYSSFTEGGVTFSLSSGNVTVSDDGNGQYVLAAPGTHFLDNRAGSDFIFDLAAPVNYFGMQIGATNSPQTLSAYDSLNNLLGSVAIPDQVTNLPYPYTGFYALSFAGIDHVTLTANNFDWIVVDNVTAVPEPETYAMLLAGLGLLGFMAHRRKETAV